MVELQRGLKPSSATANPAGFSVPPRRAPLSPRTRYHVVVCVFEDALFNLVFIFFFYGLSECTPTVWHLDSSPGLSILSFHCVSSGAPLSSQSKNIHNRLIGDLSSIITVAAMHCYVFSRTKQEIKIKQTGKIIPDTGRSNKTNLKFLPFLPQESDLCL